MSSGLNTIEDPQQVRAAMRKELQKSMYNGISHATIWSQKQTTSLILPKSPRYEERKEVTLFNTTSAKSET